MKPVTCINVARETGHAVLSLDGAEYAVSLDDLQKILADIAGDRKSTRLNSSHNRESRMPSSA